jgi:hypothetical protein
MALLSDVRHGFPGCPSPPPRSTDLFLQNIVLDTGYHCSLVSSLSLVSYRPRVAYKAPLPIALTIKLTETRETSAQE